MRFDTPITLDMLPTDDKSPLPPGHYQCSIEGAEVKKTSAGTGQYLSVMLKVQGPKSSGYVIWDNITLRNPKPQAEEIGGRKLGNLMRAVGLAKIEDTDQLLGAMVDCNVYTEAGKDQWPDKSRVKSYKAVNGSPPPSPASAPASTGGTSAPPWAPQS